MRGVDFTGLAMIGALAIAAGVAVMIWSRLSGAIGAAGALSWPAVPDAINPASTGNVIYQGVNGVVGAIAGRDETLGGALYDALNPPAFSPAVPGRMTGDAFRLLSEETFARDDREVFFPVSRIFPWLRIDPVIDSGPAFDAWERDMVN